MAEQASSLKDSKTVEVPLAPKAIKRKNTSPPPELQTPSKRTTEQASLQEERLEDVFQDEIIIAFANITLFKKFARSKNGLCLSQSYFKTIVEDHKSNVEEQKLELLFKWQEIKGEKATVPKIRHLLQKYFRRDNPSERVVDVFQDQIIKAFSSIAGFMKFARSGSGLCLDELELQNILEKHENNVEEQKMNMLFQWKTNIGDQAASVSKIRSLLQSYLARDSQEDEIRGQVAISGQTSPKKSKFECEDSGDSALSQKSSGVGDAAGTSNSAAREATVNTAVHNNQYTLQTTRVADSNSDSVDVRLSGGISPKLFGDQNIEEYNDDEYSDDEYTNEEYNSEEGISQELFGNQDQNIEEYNGDEYNGDECNSEEYNSEEDDFCY